MTEEESKKLLTEPSLPDQSSSIIYKLITHSEFSHKNSSSPRELSNGEIPYDSFLEYFMNTKKGELNQESEDKAQIISLDSSNSLTYTNIEELEPPIAGDNQDFEDIFALDF